VHCACNPNHATNALQFNVRNTLNDQVIDNVSVEIVPDEDAGEGFK